MPGSGRPSVPSHVVGIDDAPFARAHRGDVLVIGTAYSGLALQGVMTTRIRRDGRNATDRLAEMIAGSRVAAHNQAVLLQGIALGGFNVVDIHQLAARRAMAVLVVVRRRPRLDAIKRALFRRVPGGARKWALIEQAGPVEPAGPVFIQRAGIERAPALELVQRLSSQGNVPEPIRVAHLIAGGLVLGHSRGRA
jgi:endonuclease V-like protein UPF0215 family